jgi:hypothetical protein
MLLSANIAATTQTSLLRPKLRRHPEMGTK